MKNGNRREYELLKEAFNLGIAQMAGCSGNSEFDDDESIGCIAEAYSDALFVVKRHLFENGVCSAYVMDTDIFDLDWYVVFGPIGQAERERVKRAISLVVMSMYGDEVSRGMAPGAFDPQLATTFMCAVADAGRGYKLGRDALKSVFEAGLKNALKLALKYQLEDQLRSDSVRSRLAEKGALGKKI